MNRCEQMLYDIDGQRRAQLSEVQEAEYIGCLESQEPIVAAMEYDMVHVIVSFIIGSLIVLSMK